MTKKKIPPYIIKIYNNVGAYAGSLKFFDIIEALRAYSSIKRAIFFWNKKIVNDEFILFSLQVLAIIKKDHPEYFQIQKEIKNGKKTTNKNTRLKNKKG